MQAALEMEGAGALGERLNTLIAAFSMIGTLTGGFLDRRPEEAPKPCSRTEIIQISVPKDV